MNLGRRILTGLCLVLAALTLAIGAGAAGGASTAACDRPCGGGAASVSQSSRPSPLPCVRDVGCSGGLTLAAGGGIAVVLTLPAVLALALLPVWRRRRSRVNSPVGRLLSTGLFRPPRALAAA
jgi:acyl-CoA synthetase (AMP-forming)/AMP-acid ligase II